MSNNDFNCPKELRPIGAWGYVGLSILYMIPIIGWLFLIIFTFHGGNLNRRSFTRSYWCGLLVLIIVFGGLFAILRTKTGESIKDIISGLLGVAIVQDVEIPIVGVSREIKGTMDAYEAFVDEYIVFMKEYDSQEELTPEIMEQYESMMEKYTETMEEIKQIDVEKLSIQDRAYYLKVMTRITEKLDNK